eukprot:7142853-Prymnesium_polylepis.1
MTNAVGYEQRVREELGRDPNRDFPFQQAPSACMTTVVARSINELFRSRTIQLAITYHGGMQAVGYVWGDFAHRGGRTDNRSPDHAGISQLAHVAALYASSGLPRHRGRPYDADTMNSIVYPVHGGMEDWAYAASWDKGSVRPCAPTSLGGYPVERTFYDGSSARAVVLLVETSDDKTPPEKSLGAPAGMLSPGTEQDGHVPRN